MPAAHWDQQHDFKYHWRPISIRDPTFMSLERSQQAAASWLPWATRRSNYSEAGRRSYTEVTWLDGRIGDLGNYHYLELPRGGGGLKGGGGHFSNLRERNPEGEFLQKSPSLHLCSHPSRCRITLSPLVLSLSVFPQLSLPLNATKWKTHTQTYLL